MGSPPGTSTFAEGSPAAIAQVARGEATRRRLPQGAEAQDANFPRAEIQRQPVTGSPNSGQKTYNGVALLARGGLADVVSGNPTFWRSAKAPDRRDRRRCYASSVRHVPNGQAVSSDKYDYKLTWLAALDKWLTRQLAAYPQLALAGDFNIARTIATYMTRRLGRAISLFGRRARSAPATARRSVCDSFRLFKTAGRPFHSWWDRMLGFQRNQGLRIDHILLSRAVACTLHGFRYRPRNEKRRRPPTTPRNR